MEDIGIFVFGQSQEQIDNQFLMTTDKNKLLYNKIRDILYEKSIAHKRNLNLFTTLDRGLGFTTLITGVSLNNEYSKFSNPVKISVVIPHNAYSANWDYKTAGKFDELLGYAHSVSTASRTPEHTEADWVKAGKNMVDNSEFGIILLPNRTPNYLSEVIRYAFSTNVPMIKINEDDLTTSAVDLMDIMG